MAAVDLPDLHTDRKVAVALGIPLVVVHYRRVGTGPGGRYDMAQERGLVMLPELHCAGDRTKRWQASSPRNLRGTVPAFR